VVERGFSDLLLWNANTGTAVGSLQSTVNPLDVALDGPGFLAVSTGLGVRYTRNGELVIDGDGRLATDPGNLVLGTSGSPITVGRVSDPCQISIDARGTVKVGTRTVGTLAVVSLTGATKQAETLFTGTPGVRPARTAVRQRFLEGSGVRRRRETSA
jgi:flagellar basal-body rod protein FlgF